MLIVQVYNVIVVIQTQIVVAMIMEVLDVVQFMGALPQIVVDRVGLVTQEI